MPSQKRGRAALAETRQRMQAARQEALSYRRVYDSIAEAFAKADECLAIGAISPGYAEDVQASLTAIQAQALTVPATQMETLGKQAWNIRNRLLNCEMAQRDLDKGFLANEEAWAAYLKEYGIDASEVKKVEKKR